MAIKKYPNHEPIRIPVKVISTASGPNRSTRRRDDAWLKETKNRKKKNNIRLAQSATYQRELAKSKK